MTNPAINSPVAASAVQDTRKPARRRIPARQISSTAISIHPARDAVMASADAQHNRGRGDRCCVRPCAIDRACGARRRPRISHVASWFGWPRFANGRPPGGTAIAKSPSCSRCSHCSSATSRQNSPDRSVQVEKRLMTELAPKRAASARPTSIARDKAAM